MTPGVSAGPKGDVDVIQRKQVGIYDTAVLSSRDRGALLDWLSKNGFVTPTNFVAAIHDYAKEGWFFVASKISLDASLTIPAKPSPLALTFKTERPVYPLRLTGIGNETCQIDLYVFGPNRADAPNFTVERCAWPLYPATNGVSWPHRLEELRIRHPGLRMLVNESPVATKLTARLNSQQMREDAYITWTPFEAKRLVFYSAHGATVLATNLTIPFVIAALLTLFWIRGREGLPVQRLRRACVTTLCSSLLFWLLINVLLPQIPVVVQAMPERRSEEFHYDITSMLENRASTQRWNFSPDLAWVREQIADSIRISEQLRTFVRTNFFTGQPCREEDSPGNYTLRHTAEGLEYVWYDFEGGEHPIPLFRKKE
jgi:hypothetical protein